MDNKDMEDSQIKNVDQDSTGLNFPAETLLFLREDERFYAESASKGDADSLLILLDILSQRASKHSAYKMLTEYWGGLAFQIEAPEASCHYALTLLNDSNNNDAVLQGLALAQKSTKPEIAKKAMQVENAYRTQKGEINEQKKVEKEKLEPINTVQSDNTPSSDLKINENGLLVRYTGTDEILVLPDNVSAIGYRAFVENTTLKRIVFSDSVLSMWKSAFYECTSLESVVFGRKLKEIAPYAFYGCTNLLEINFGSVQKIGERAFDGCKSLVSITMPEGLLEIASHAFDGCTNLESVTVPASLRYLGLFAFANCPKLPGLIHKGTIKQWQQATMTNGNNQIVRICAEDNPHSEFEIDEVQCLTSYAGQNQVVYIPDGVKKIGFEAFRGNSTVEELFLPSSVEIIDSYAFARCSRLRCFTIAGQLLEICNNAFADCSRLEKINIPMSVKQIGRYAFVGCSSLANVQVEGTLDDWMKKNIEMGNLNLKKALPFKDIPAEV